MTVARTLRSVALGIKGSSDRVIRYIVQEVELMTYGLCHLQDLTNQAW